MDFGGDGDDIETGNRDRRIDVPVGLVFSL